MQSRERGDETIVAWPLLSPSWLAFLTYTAVSRSSDCLHGSATSSGPASARLHRLARSPAPRPRCRWYRHHHGRRDLDQLVVAEPLAGEVVKVLVAVADVDALVAPGSAIDDHARSNTTSVYTAAKVFPMLPEKLSTDLTSLREGEERLAVVIEITIDGEGRISASDVPSSTTAC
jgi:hypothetical protein